MQYRDVTAERLDCAECGRRARRLVAARPLCTDHFTNLLEHCRHAARRALLTPPADMGHADTWAQRLTHGVTIGVITPDERRDAWEAWRDFHLESAS